ncbi:MAG: rod-binding protein [Treponema sp.]|jgi:flagellar protein FlgJ|nr:rod-binding protein [Treponema sp.]
MDTSLLGALHLDNARFTPVALNTPGEGSSPAGPAGRSGRTFAEELEMARASRQAGEGPSAASPAGGESAGLPPKEKPLVDKKDKLYEQCEALETFLIKTLITGMRNTVQKSGLIEEGFAGKMYEDMLYDEYAKDFTKNAGFGLAELAYLELTGQRGKISPERL